MDELISHKGWIYIFIFQNSRWVSFIPVCLETQNKNRKMSANRIGWLLSYKHRWWTVKRKTERQTFPKAYISSSLRISTEAVSVWTTKLPKIFYSQHSKNLGIRSFKYLQAEELDFKVHVTFKSLFSFSSNSVFERAVLLLICIQQG